MSFNGEPLSYAVLPRVRCLVRYISSCTWLQSSGSSRNAVSTYTHTPTTYRSMPMIKRSLTANSKTLLVLASMHSCLDYSNSVLYSLPWSCLQLLQSVLNSAARLIRGLKRFDRISPVLIDLHWLPYPQRIKYKVCMLMFKCLRGLAPA